MNDFMIYVMIILIPIVMILIPFYLATKPNNKPLLRMIGVVILAALVFAGFSLMEMGTLKPTQRLSNGNPMILFIPWTILTSAALCYVLTAISFRLFARMKWLPNLIIIAGVLLLELYLLFAIKLELHAVLQQLGGGPNNPSSVIHGRGWFNVYTYKVYFNLYSYVLFILLSVQLGDLIHLIARLVKVKARGLF